jgi:hypothetical protein
MLQNLIAQWHSLGPSDELFDLADQIISESSTADEIAELPYVVGNNFGSWRAVGKRVALACDKIAAAALARDPDNESALWLYEQPDFLARVGRKRPPITPPNAEQRIAKIERILALYVEDVVHPLDIPSLETIALDDVLVLDAMLDAFARAPKGRARHAFIEALGATLIEHERVAHVLAAALEEEGDIDNVCMAFHYGLKRRGVCAVEAVRACALRIIDDLREGDGDWRHMWPVRAAVTLDRSFTAELRRAATAMPAWKQAKIATALVR